MPQFCVCVCVGDFGVDACGRVVSVWVDFNVCAHCIGISLTDYPP